MARTDATKRTKKLQLRLRPAELTALQQAVKRLGIRQSEALRGWIAAGVRGALPVEGLLQAPPAPANPEEPAEAISA